MKDNMSVLDALLAHARREASDFPESWEVDVKALEWALKRLREAERIIHELLDTAVQCDTGDSDDPMVWDLTAEPEVYDDMLKFAGYTEET